MKNSLSKTLLCGVLASTFFLINCQKAPSRGVKAGTGAASPAAQTEAQKLAGKVVVDCSDSFLKALEEARIPKDKIIANIKASKEGTKTLTEAEKAEIKSVREDVIVKNKVVVAEMAKLKKGDVAAEACTSKDKTSYIFETIKAAMNSLVIEAGTAAGVDDEEQKQAVLDKKDREAKKEVSSLAQKMKLIVSADLAEALKSENKNGVVYFKAGSIVKDSGSDLETLKKDKTKTVCELSSVTPEDLVLAGADSLEVISYGSKKKDLRTVFDITMMKADKMLYTINCLIADGKEKLVELEFRNAFGKHLRTQAQIDKDDKKEKTTLEKATADLEKKTKAHEEAVKASKEASDAYDVKLKEIDAAREKKDAALVDSLNEKASPAKIRKEKAEKTVAEALKAKDAAQKAVDDLK